MKVSQHGTEQGPKPKVVRSQKQWVTETVIRYAFFSGVKVGQKMWMSLAQKETQTLKGYKSLFGMIVFYLKIMMQMRLVGFLKQ